MAGALYDMLAAGGLLLLSGRRTAKYLAVGVQMLVWSGYHARLLLQHKTTWSQGNQTLIARRSHSISRLIRRQSAWSLA
ncbi:hypothetical protein [Sodalis glossinidius]|uniref:hypothetical protein n=1 Tax=Sodalis glossinidius TaxID=63612 RepID=UPI0003182403|nr:hypothetical protein [Sodalis glossinidius]